MVCHKIKDTISCVSSIWVLIVLFSCSSSTTPDNEVASPVFTPPAGIYTQAQQVSISCATQGAEIRYTLDGSTPPTNSMVYTGPFLVELGKTVKAIASKAGMNDSPVVQSVYQPPVFSIIGSCDTPGTAFSVAVNGGYVYIADGESGFQIINVNNPASPFITGTCQTPGTVQQLFVSSNYAYVTGSEGLQVINISNPSNPQIVGFCDLGSESMYGVAVIGNYAYVTSLNANGYGHLFVIDISNHSLPNYTGFSLEGLYGQIEISGSYAYVADGVSGLQILNISNPVEPFVIGTCEFPESGSKISVFGDYAYVDGFNNTLKILNISNPSNPRIVGSYEHPGYMGGIAVSGNYAYVGYLDEDLTTTSIQLISISDPSNPHLVFSYDIPALTLDVSLSGNNAYAAAGEYGLFIIALE